MSARGSESTLSKFGGYAGLVTAAGLVAAAALPSGPDNRLGALVGVGIAGVTSLFALWLKQRAVKKSLGAALGAVGIVFAVRMVLVAAGLFWVMGRGAGLVAFVAGFFGAYFALQWIEIAYVMAESKRRGPGES